MTEAKTGFGMVILVFALLAFVGTMATGALDFSNVKVLGNNTFEEDYPPWFRGAENVTNLTAENGILKLEANKTRGVYVSERLRAENVSEIELAPVGYTSDLGTGSITLNVSGADTIGFDNGTTVTHQLGDGEGTIPVENLDNPRYINFTLVFSE